MLLPAIIASPEIAELRRESEENAAVMRFHPAGALGDEAFVVKSINMNKRLALRCFTWRGHLAHGLAVLRERRPYSADSAVASARRVRRNFACAIGESTEYRRSSRRTATVGKLPTPRFFCAAIAAVMPRF